MINQQNFNYYEKTKLHYRKNLIRFNYPRNYLPFKHCLIFNRLYLTFNLLLIMKTKIQNFLKTIEIDNVNIMDFVNIDDIDYSDAYSSIYEMINENRGFEVEIIYYSKAIEYLMKNDPSLRESIAIAMEYGYDTYENINSEFLASIHASVQTKIDFEYYENQINEFFLNLLIN